MNLRQQHRLYHNPIEKSTNSESDDIVKHLKSIDQTLKNIEIVLSKNSVLVDNLKSSEIKMNPVETTGFIPSIDTGDMTVKGSAILSTTKTRNMSNIVKNLKTIQGESGE